MKLKKVRQTVIVLIVLASLVLFGACSSNKSKDIQERDAGITEESYAMDTADMGTSTASIDEAGANANGVESSKEMINSNSQVAGQKLIKDVTMSVETKEFDDFITDLNHQITSLGGYVESSDISGGSYQYDNYRYGNIVARIPADKLDGFVNIVNQKGNVVHTSEQTTDVTLQYVDIESHLKALKLEQETLMNLLEKATSMEDVISIQSQLTQVRYEIESNESQIKTYDNLVNYSTVRIDITEVERETQKESTSFAGEIKIKLSNNLYAIKEGFRSFLIEFIAALPYLVIWGIIIVIAIIIGRKGYKKITKKSVSNKNKEKKSEDTKKDESEMKK